jgi:hypothetical protein
MCVRLLRCVRARAGWVGCVCLRCSFVWQDVTDEVDEAIRRMKTVEKRLTELASREALWSHVLEKLSTLLAYGRALSSVPRTTPHSVTPNHVVANHAVVPWHGCASQPPGMQALWRID